MGRLGLMASSASKKPVVVAVTGASGSILALRLVQVLLRLAHPVELIFTEKAQQVLHEETSLRTSAHNRKAALLHYLGLPQAAPLELFGNQQLDAPSASGTHLTRGMVVIPCSVGTLGRINAGLGDNLVARAADVHLKENRTLIVVPRECPLSAIHLKNLVSLRQAGAIILPPMLTFYLPAYHSLEGQIDFIVARVLDQLDIPHRLSRRWAADGAA